MIIESIKNWNNKDYWSDKNWHAVDDLDLIYPVTNWMNKISYIKQSGIEGFIFIHLAATPICLFIIWLCVILDPLGVRK